MAIEIDLKRNSGLPSLGTHTWKIVSVAEEIGGSGFPYWRFDCLVQDKGEDQGKKATAWVSHSPAAQWKRDEFLDAVDAARTGKAVGESFIGKVFRGTCEHNERDGKLYANVDTYLPAGSTTSAPLKPPDDKDYSETLPDDVAPGKKPPPF